MFYQKVVDGQLVNYPVLQDQVPSDEADLYHLIDMEPPSYDPTTQTCTDNGISVGDDGIPVRTWTITDTPEILVDTWENISGRGKLILLRIEDKSGQDWDTFRSGIQAIIDNAELQSPVGSIDTINWPTPPEEIIESVLGSMSEN